MLITKTEITLTVELRQEEIETLMYLIEPIPNEYENLVEYDTNLNVITPQGHKFLLDLYQQFQDAVRVTHV